MRLHKSYKANFKALPEEGDGTFEAIVSVFGNVDLVGDRVVKGAFEKSLQKWSKSGDPIPVIHSHRWDDLDAHVGIVLEAEEREEGLWVKGQIDMDDPAAAKVYKLLKRRSLREFSFAYDVVREKSGADGANELLELDIIEVGPTLKGANDETQLLGVKTGRVLSKRNEAKLRDAVTMIQEVLATVEDEPKNRDPETPEGDDPETKEPAKTEEPAEAKVEEPSLTPGTVSLRAELEALDA